MMKRMMTLDPATYRRHLLHGENRIWVETNCYVDVWIELLHAWGYEPLAALAFTVGIDFEGDQWTFFKYPHADLYELYGLETLELAIWRPIVSHIEEQLLRGRPVLVELDSFYLPDTAGTAYQRAHVKSTAAIVAIDVEKQQLGYFHNQAYHHLEGSDFRNIFRIDSTDATILPPYVEFVKQRGPALRDDDLMQAALQQLRRQLRLVPETNPFTAFRARFDADLDWLMATDLEMFHQYSFATLRQFGACFELAGSYLQWLREQSQRPLQAASAAFTELATGAKALQFQLARAIARKKKLDLSSLDALGQRWEKALAELQQVAH